MRMIWQLLKQVYEWNKWDFWMINILCLISGGILMLVEPHPFLVMGVIIILFVKIFHFSKAASISPSAGAENNQFTLKYIQSLPLDRQEILIFLILGNFFAMFPFVVWFLAFHSAIWKHLFDLETISTIAMIKIISTGVLVLLFSTLMSFKVTLQTPRQQHSRKNQKEAIYQFIRTLILVVVGFLYLLIALYILEFDYNVPLGSVLLDVFDRALTFLGTWWWPVVAMGLLVYHYSMTLKVWANEKLSYVKINWIGRRDVPIIMLGTFLFAVPFNSETILVPHHYRTTPLLRAVYHKDLKKLIVLVEKGEDLNEDNKYGMTPLLAAASLGQHAAFLYLAQNGASKEGTLKNFSVNNSWNGANLLIMAIKGQDKDIVGYLLDEGFSPNTKNEEGGYYAIHSAAFSSPEILDLLINRGVDVRVKNSLGQTPLHVATKYRRFANVVSLIEAGADLNEKDNNSKKVTDYDFKNYSHELRYYLDKKSRLPASVGNIKQ